LLAPALSGSAGGTVCSQLLKNPLMIKSSNGRITIFTKNSSLADSFPERSSLANSF